jgi:hypothetical protein
VQQKYKKQRGHNYIMLKRQRGGGHNWVVLETWRNVTDKYLKNLFKYILYLFYHNGTCNEKL